MKRVRVFIFSVLFLAFSNPCYSQTSKSNKNSKPSVVNKKGSTSKINSSATTIKKSRKFEGALLYRSMEWHNSAARKFSFGMAYNGERTTKVILKGDVMHLSDETTHVHTYINPSQNAYVIYSDLTNEGVAFTISDLKTYRNGFGNDGNYWSQKKSKTENVSYKGDRCNVNKINLQPQKGDIKGSGNIEVWYSDAYTTTDTYRYFSNGLNTGGIIKKWVYNLDIGAIFFSLRSVVAEELIAIDEHSVSEVEIAIPSEIQIKTNAKNKDLIKFYKNNNKEMNKLKIKPKNQDANLVIRKINDEWNYIKDWHDNSSEIYAARWKNVGIALFENAASNIKERTIFKQSYSDAGFLEGGIVSKSSRQAIAASKKKRVPGMSPVSGVVAMGFYEDGIWYKDEESRDYVLSHLGNPKTDKVYMDYLRLVQHKPSAIDHWDAWKAAGEKCDNILDLYASLTGFPQIGKKTNDCGVCKGNARCISCKGTGRVFGKDCTLCVGGKCKSCKGKGTKTHYSHMIDFDKIKGGLGAQTDFSSERSVVDKEERCGQCTNGDCRVCGGRGTITEFGVTRICYDCNGLKKCKVCDGKGKVKVKSRELI